jgi:putative PIN family toxin of toxin-antitoxin system
MSYAPKKIVIDTSSLIGACIYPEREPAFIIKQAILRFQLVASPQTKNELEDVLKRDKFNKWQTFDFRMAWLEAYLRNLEMYTPTQFFTNSIDPKDNKFLDVAVESNASAIICSDDHLLTLHPFKEHGGIIELLTLRKFHELYLLDK